MLRHVDPPMPAWRYARANLLLFVDEDLGLRAAADQQAAAAAQLAWREWFEANRHLLSWRPDLGRYELDDG